MDIDTRHAFQQPQTFELGQWVVLRDGFGTATMPFRFNNGN